MLRVFPSWCHVEAGVGAESGEGGGDFDSIAMFHVWSSSFKSRVVVSLSGNLLLQRETRGEYGVFLEIYADGALPLLELWPHPRSKGSEVLLVAWMSSWEFLISSFGGLAGESGDGLFENRLLDAVMDICFWKGFPMWTFGRKVYLYVFSKTQRKWCDIVLLVGWIA